MCPRATGRRTPRPARPTWRSSSPGGVTRRSRPGSTPRSSGTASPRRSATPAPTASPPVPTEASSDALLAAAAQLAASEGERAVIAQGAGAYVVGVDVAEGEANTFNEGDYHAATVFDHRTFEQVAIHVSRMDLHDLPYW